MYWGPQSNLLCVVLTLMFHGDEKLVCGVDTLLIVLSMVFVNASHK